MVPRTALAGVLVAVWLSGCSLLNQGLPGAQTGPSPSAVPASSAADHASPTGPPTPTAAPPNRVPSTEVVTVTVTGSVSPSVRTRVLATDVLDTAGLGPLQLGMSLATLRQRGYVVAATDSCVEWEAAPALRSLGVEVQLYHPDGRLGEIWLQSPTIKTRSGATVGMTVAKLKQIYGAKLVVETKNGNGGPFQVLVVKDVAREVVFMIDWEAQPVSDGDTIRSIVARTASHDMFGGC